MRAQTVRSGLVESDDGLSGCIVDGDDAVVFSTGDPDRPLFYRSAIKPVQASVVVDLGTDLPAEHLALASASHSGTPAHIAIVDAILTDAGLDRSALQTPPDEPISEEAVNALIASGREFKAPVLHNCSGKHAGFLAACVVAGYDPATYLDPEHPLQRQIIERVGEVTRIDPEPVGVDGCGAPTLRGTPRGLARAFAAVATEPRFAEVATAVARYPALVGGNERSDTKLAVWWPGPAKGGAEGLLGLGRPGFGAAIKSHGGSIENAVAGMIEMLRRIGALSDAALADLADVAARPVYGGGKPQGEVRVVDA